MGKNEKNIIMLKKLTMLAFLASSATAQTNLPRRYQERETATLQSGYDDWKFWTDITRCNEETDEETCKTSTREQTNMNGTTTHTKPNNCIWIHEPELLGTCGTKIDRSSDSYTANQAECFEATDAFTCGKLANGNTCEWEDTPKCTFEAQEARDCDYFNEPGCDEVSGCTWTTPDGEDEPTCTFTGFSATATTVITAVSAVTASVLVLGVIRCLCKKYFSKAQEDTEAATDDSVLDVNDSNDNGDSTNNDEGAKDDASYTSTRMTSTRKTSTEESTQDSTTQESSFTDTEETSNPEEEEI